MNVLQTIALIPLLTSYIARTADVINEGSFEQNTGLNLPYNFITVSLGSNCQTADFMRAHNIRFFAAPFDWCITPYKSLYKVMKNSFKDFFKKEHLTLHAWDTTHTVPNGILDTKTGIFYNHDFPSPTFASIDKHYQAQYDKYKRRVNRLFKLMKSGKHVYFIRYLDTTRTQAYQLYLLLKSKFPQTAFTLIIIGNNAEEFEQDWAMPHIRNFFIYSEHTAETGYKTLQENPFWRDLCDAIRSGALLEQ